MAVDEKTGTALAVIGGATIATGAGVALWWYTGWDQRSNARVSIVERIMGTTSTPVTRAMLETWIGTRGELRPASERPSDARMVPVIAKVWSPLVARPRRTSMAATAASRLLYLDTMRAVMRQAERTDEDVRCVLCLKANESAWDQYGWNYNYGNVKSQGTVWGDASTLLGAGPPMVWTTSRDSCGVYLLRDRYLSFDGYHAMPDAATSFRWHKRVLERRFPEVIEGYRRGGLDGLLYAEEFIARRGYAERAYDPARADERDERGLRIRLSMADYVALRQREARGYWANMTRMLGPGFVR